MLAKPILAWAPEMLGVKKIGGREDCEFCQGRDSWGLRRSKGLGGGGWSSLVIRWEGGSFSLTRVFLSTVILCHNGHKKSSHLGQLGIKFSRVTVEICSRLEPALYHL